MIFLYNCDNYLYKLEDEHPNLYSIDCHNNNNNNINQIKTQSKKVKKLNN